jgi:pimeloyl-ACP methyl ester carboxylesterase/DNA-binding CsgD family transcriptional regulator
VLLDDKDRATAHSNNIGSLGEFVRLKGKHNRLAFLDPASQASFEHAKAKLDADGHGHALVELTSPTGHQQRFGYLVGKADFPGALRQMGGSPVRALMVPHEEPNDKLRRVIQTSFGLTGAENEITMKLAGGLTLKDTAAQLGISVNTARNHLQSVFDKSGIKRQTDLILVVTQLSVILAATADTSADLPTIVANELPDVQPQHFIILPSGRRLAYRTYGDPMGNAVLYFHETIGSSRLLPATDHLARERGLYVIAAERPGFGYSDPDPDYSFPSIVADMQRLLDHLRVTEVALLGFMAGAGHALMCASSLTQTITQVLLVGGRPPLPLSGTFNFLRTLRTRMVKQPWLLSTFFNILRNRSSRATNERLIRNVYGTVPHDNAYLDEHPDVLEHMVAYTMESMTITAAGIVNELQSFNDPDPCDLENITAPIVLWHGDADHMASVQDLQDYLGDKVTATRTFKDSGSLLLLEFWPEVLDQLGKGPPT